MILHADCVEAMRGMDEASVDAIVTDPPAGISFMGREWDSDRSGGFIEWLTEVMAEALRVTKPGGHALVWALPRTSHWTGMACEKAGWEIRDRIAHHFGSGFPKSLDVSKAIDKAAGAEREVVGRKPVGWGGLHSNERLNDDGWDKIGTEYPEGQPITAPATPEAAQWQGWGTALKPATEDWWLCRKPLIGTVSRNVQEFGTGALNVDACRVGYQGDADRSKSARTGDYDERQATGVTSLPQSHMHGEQSPAGRWPANVALSHLDECEAVGTRRVKASLPASGPTHEGPSERGAMAGDFGGMGDRAPANYADADGCEEVTAWRCAESCPVAMLDEQSGDSKSTGGQASLGAFRNGDIYGVGRDEREKRDPGLGDTGGASRFFYTAKSSRAERNAGLRGFEEQDVFRGNHADNPVCQSCGGSKIDRGSGECRCAEPDWRVGDRGARNSHPTVKPIALMRWLCRLVTPPEGTILDPFVGSGTTGAAAALEGFEFIGIEREAEYVAIAEARIAWWSEHQGREAEEVLADSRRSEVEREKHEASGQMELMEPAA